MATEQKLQQWVVAQLQAASLEDIHWQVIPGDASFRHYFRCAYQSINYIVALAPPETEKNHEFVTVANLLQRFAIKASEVIAVDYEYGFILQKDLGQTLLADVLSDDSVDGWYQKATQQLLALQKIPVSALDDIGVYDEAALRLELSYFVTWFLGEMLNYSLSSDEQVMLDAFFDELIASALAQPQGFVHRDYHCRNIMVAADGELAAIDFQDALQGPLTYDVVSLLRDCYVVWPQQRVHGWLQDFHCALAAENIIDAEAFDAAAMLKAFDRMGLQRHIKVLGIFARLSIRDGKHAYLADLPTVVTYVRKVLANIGPCSLTTMQFRGWFESKVMPEVRQQTWAKQSGVSL